MKKRLITAALPYVNNIPHLGNLVQILSADVFARYCRQAGYETLYVCGTDEYGTATETKALQEGLTPKELCDRYHKEHILIYEWFNIDFDNFSRTSNDTHTQMVQDIFRRIDEAGYVQEQEDEQHYCDTCKRFLADRFVVGVCSFCGYDQAKGDQCEECGKVLEVEDLKNPTCMVCNSATLMRKTKNLYIDLPALANELESWVKDSQLKKLWASNALSMTRSWLRDGLKKRCITRDLDWGIPVPKAGYENKVFYVWFDAPIGYISMTKELLKDSWSSWWHSPQNVELVQFIGKDNIPFHTVVFPATLLATRESWTMLHRISSTEYLNYETGKFSKSRGIGVFGSDCLETNIDTDLWRFYLMYMRPEKSDTSFSWTGLKDIINSELVGNLGNLVNRTLAFCIRFYDGVVPNGQRDDTFWRYVQQQESKIIALMDQAELKEALKGILQLSDFGNKEFQRGEPWRTRTQDPLLAKNLIFNLTYLILDLARLLLPYLPNSAYKLARMLQGDLSWQYLGLTTGLGILRTNELLFEILDDDTIDALRKKFGGKQVEKSEKMDQVDSPIFSAIVDLRVAKIIDIKRHLESDSLYIIQIQIGEHTRQIVSSLVPYYREEELLGGNVIVVANLKKSKFRGVESFGMLLAAENESDECEVLFSQSPHDTRVLPENESDREHKPLIKIDEFTQFSLVVKNGVVYLGDQPLVAGNNVVKTNKLLHAIVG